MGETRKDANGFSPWIGSNYRDHQPFPGPPNPIPSDAPTTSTVNSAQMLTSFSSKNLSDVPTTPTVTTTPVALPQAENAKRSVNVAGNFGTVKNPA